MNRRTTASLFGLACGSILAAALAPAGPPVPYEIDWHTMDGSGGGTSAGAGFQVDGTIGQFDAGGPMTSGPFSMTGGYWVVAAGGGGLPCPADCAAPPNGLVNVNDLLALLAQWGGPGGCDIAPPFGVVNVNDLLALLAAWGACP